MAFINTHLNDVFNNNSLFMNKIWFDVMQRRANEFCIYLDINILKYIGFRNKTHYINTLQAIAKENKDYIKIRSTDAIYGILSQLEHFTPYFNKYKDQIYQNASNDIDEYECCITPACFEKYILLAIQTHNTIQLRNEYTKIKQIIKKYMLEKA